ncbi:MAG TPA: glycosyl hydrolase family 79 C-terminal domain-containing protein [Solirubrobacteraceae bacterium]|jgi:hypothetical protein
MSRRRSLLAAIAVACVLPPIATATPPNAAATPTNAPARATNVVTIGAAATPGTIPPGFLGLSLEYFAIEPYAGTNPSSIDPVFVQLIRNLSPGQAPELRIGGDTTDRTWWPVPGMPTPAGVTATLTRNWLDVTHALATQLGAQLTLGINFEADSTKVAGAEANAELDGIGRSRIAAFELGNEPELYGSFDWGLSGAPGRPKGYDFEAFAQDFTRIGRAMPHLPLAGPTDGGTRWFPKVGTFLSDHPQVAVATIHRYPLESCYVKPSDPSYPTIPHMLSPAATSTLARSVTPAVRQAHARHVPIRVDEINTISCGWDPAVSRSFASALWSLDTLFELAGVGVDGVNLHTFPGATYALFRFAQVGGQWRGIVMPEYYGLDMFAQAAPPGSRLLRASATGTAARQLRAFATRAPDGTIRVVVINEGSSTRTLRVAPPAGSATGTGAVERLDAPSLAARVDVTLAGQSFGASTATGLLAGTRSTPTVAPVNGEYTLRIPSSSATMLTLPPG